MLTRRNPFMSFSPFQNSVFDDIFDSNNILGISSLISKKLDNGCLAISLDLPGVKEDDLRIELSEDNRVCIRGKRDCDGSYYETNRSFNLPKNYNYESIKAELTNGVLTLTLDPSSEKTKRLIPLKK